MRVIITSEYSNCTDYCYGTDCCHCTNFCRYYCADLTYLILSSMTAFYLELSDYILHHRTFQN